MATDREPDRDDEEPRREPLPVAPPAAFAQLFDARGSHREVALDELATLAIDDRQMLWVDVQGDDEALLQRVRAALDLPAPEFPGTSQPAALDLGTHFAVRVVAVRPGNGQAGYDGDVLDIDGGANRLLTVHRAPLPFLDALRERDRPPSGLGTLSAESFAAVVLDAHLSTYFEAVSAFEAAVERLELEIFDDRHLGSLPELRTLRRGASRLRRMLSPHRAVYGVLSRPDFRPAEGRTDADRHFAALDVRFERAMDMVENCRELVMGSFDLFSNQTALRMNASMKVLTFATVVLGILAVVGGVLGMNFEATFFAAEDGFWYAVAGLVLLALLALLLGRWRRWF